MSLTSFLDSLKSVAVKLEKLESVDYKAVLDRASVVVGVVDVINSVTRKSSTVNDTVEKAKAVITAANSIVDQVSGSSN